LALKLAIVIFMDTLGLMSSYRKVVLHLWELAK
jgi:hypothetical protein